MVRGDGHGLWGEGALDWREAKEVNLPGSVAGASGRARSLGLGVLRSQQLDRVGGAGSGERVKVGT